MGDSRVWACGRMIRKGESPPLYPTPDHRARLAEQRRAMSGGPQWWAVLPNDPTNIVGDTQDAVTNSSLSFYCRPCAALRVGISRPKIIVGDIRIWPTSSIISDNCTMCPNHRACTTVVWEDDDDWRGSQSDDGDSDSDEMMPPLMTTEYRFCLYCCCNSCGGCIGCGGVIPRALLISDGSNIALQRRVVTPGLSVTATADGGEEQVHQEVIWHARMGNNRAALTHIFIDALNLINHLMMPCSRARAVFRSLTNIKK